MDLFKNIIIKLNTIYENVEALIGPISDIEQQKKNRTLMKCQNWIDFKTISIKFQYNILMSTTNCYVINFVSIGKKIGY